MRSETDLGNAQPTGAPPSDISPEVYQRRWLILGAMCLCLLLVVASVSSLNVAIPTIARELRPTDTQILWIVDAYALVFAGLLLFAGALGDRFGRKGALQIGLTIFAAASVACAWASDPNLLIALRGVMGVGAALIMPATLSIVTHVFTPQERPKAIAIWAAFAGAGGAIGPVMSGLLLVNFWYGSAFFVAAPIAVIAFAAVTVLAPSSREGATAALDPVGAVLSMAGFSALLFAIIEGPEKGWTSPLVIGGFVVAVGALCGFVIWEKRQSAPMLDMSFFSNARFSIGSMGITFTFMAMFAMFFVLSQYLQYVRGYSALRSGVAGLPFAGVMILVSPRAVQVAARLGVRTAIVSGLALVSIGMIGFSLITVDAPYVIVALCLMVMAAGMAIAMPSMTAGIMSAVPPHKSGVGSAVNDTTRELGGAIGIALVGSIVSAMYRDGIRSSLANVPPEASEQILKSVGRGQVVVGEARTSIGDQAADGLLTAMRTSFLDGAQTGLRIVAIVVAVAAAIVAWRHPARVEAPTGAH